MRQLVFAWVVALATSISPLALYAESIDQVTSANTHEKKQISYADFARWRQISEVNLSDNGEWVVYALKGKKIDGELVVRHRSGQPEFRIARADTPKFSFDKNYLAFAVRPTTAEIEKAKKDKKKPEDSPKPGAGVLDLASGKVTLFDNVKQFDWPEQGGELLALLFETPIDKLRESKTQQDVDASDDDQAAPAQTGNALRAKKNLGGELKLIHMRSQQARSWQGVTDYLWSKNGSRLVFAVTALDATKKVSENSAAKNVAANGERLAEGVYLFTVDGEQLSPLLLGKARYAQLRFDEKGQQLAIVSNVKHVAELEKKPKEGLLEKSNEADKKDSRDEADKKDSRDEADRFDLYLWKAQDGTIQRIGLDNQTGIPPAWSVSPFASTVFSKDGKRLLVGTAPLLSDESKRSKELTRVDLWHWKDPELQSVQKVRAEKDKQKYYRALFHIESAKWVQLSDQNMPNVILNQNARYALGLSGVPYLPEISWGHRYNDVYRVDLLTGERTLLASKQLFPYQLSPEGKFIVGYDAQLQQYVMFNNQESKPQKVIVSGKVNHPLGKVNWDEPSPRPPYGIAGWREKDSALVVYDQYDVWQLDPSNQSAHNLTSGYGRKNKSTLRYINLESDESNAESDSDRELQDAKPLTEKDWTLRSVNQETKDEALLGFDQRIGSVKSLVNGKYRFSQIKKAKSAPVYVYARENFSEFPDLWLSEGTLVNAKKISTVNPQQNEYVWGTQELISYKTLDGKTEQALLAKPSNFQGGKKYPLMVYIYEKLTDNLHAYVPPAASQNINVTRFVSNGYLVVRPDISYQIGAPGRSGYNAVMGVVQQLIQQGLVDPTRIGIQGHSWGAYQINYILTKTSLFRAAESGASMANMTSGYGGIRWGAGVSRAFQYETGQSRMGVPPWGDPQRYIENSALFNAHKITTPWLSKHNDDDDAVPWYQAIEMFTALRRLGKEAYWFNYNGEKHGLRDFDNVQHYTVHMTEFFDHLLLNKPRPEWMEKPIPYLERGRRSVENLYK